MSVDVYNRVELKYLLNQEEINILLPLLEEKMTRDAYNTEGKTYLISNVYFDTPSNELIIKSLEKPVYKEKLRLRSYGQIYDKNETVYLEIKKKFNGVVYKRRIAVSLFQAEAFLQNGSIPQNLKSSKQVLYEIQDIMNRYVLVPKVFISYDRLAFFGKDDFDFRLTLDKNILTRRKDLSLTSPVYGENLLPAEKWLLEAKAFKAFPLWFAHFLSQNKIYNTSFSKYGSEYKKYSGENIYGKFF